MNVGSEIPPKSDRGLHGSDPRTVNVQVVELRPEEIKMHRECSRNSFYKAGLPFAIFCSVVSNFLRKPDSPPVSLARKGVSFLGNVLIGVFLYSPVCYYKVLAMHKEYEKQKMNTDTQVLLPVEDSRTEIRPEDFSYPVDVVSNLNEPEANFSSDFSTPIGLLSDDEKEFKKPATTYQALRAQHRSSYANKPPSPPSSQNFESDLTSTLYSSPTDKLITSQPSPTEPPPRRVVRNKYGDEIE